MVRASESTISLQTEAEVYAARHFFFSSPPLFLVVGIGVSQFMPMRSIASQKFRTVQA
jgi:hypothetical protein